MAIDNNKLENQPLDENDNVKSESKVTTVTEMILIFPPDIVLDDEDYMLDEDEES